MQSDIQNGSSAMNLLIACARESFRRLHRLSVESSTDTWPFDDLLPLARRHRVLGLIHAGSPGANSPSWQTAAFGQAAHASRCVSMAEQISHQLSAPGRSVLIIKGPALAKQAWPDIGLRSFDDLDFRCPRDAYDSICRVMHEAGFESMQAGPSQQVHYWRYGWGISFKHTSGIIAEFNHRFFPPHWPWPQSLQPGNAMVPVDVELDTTEVKTLSPAFHLLTCCVHALWHGGERLSWLIDIAGLLARNPNLLDEATQLTRNTFLRRCLHTVCQVTKSLLGPDLGDASSDWVDEEAVALYLKQLEGGHHPTANERQKLHNLILPSIDRSYYHLARLLTPGDGDFRRWNLPPSLGKLYWLLRPIRILSARRSRIKPH